MNEQRWAECDSDEQGCVGHMKGGGRGGRCARTSRSRHVAALTFLLAVVVALPVCVCDVLEREEEEDHLALLVLYGHDVQQTPEG